MTKTANSEIGAETGSSLGGSKVISFAVLNRDGGMSIQFPLYWVKYAPEITAEESLCACLNQVLVDPVFQTGAVLSTKELPTVLSAFKKEGFRWLAYKQFLPGVTDNLAHTIKEALLLKGIDEGVSVASGCGYLFTADASASNKDVETTAQYHLFHPLVERLFVVDLDGDCQDVKLSGFPDVVLTQPKAPETIDLSSLSDAALIQMSKAKLLALSLEEMIAIRDHFAKPSVIDNRKKHNLPAAPTDVELEIIAQTWSEHCKHKIFNAEIQYTEKLKQDDKSGSSKTINSLYKTYIKGATEELKAERPDLLSVFEDNSGVVKWNEEFAVCFKVETHNSPSALEPYGGALTGILGVNRDILGTGLGAKPIFNTDIFCFAHPDSSLVDRPKMLPPAAIPSGVRKGVQDGGNKSGIPTVNGSIFFHDGYRAKPLVFCGTGGILPIKRDGINLFEKHTIKGDRVVMVGGRVGQDGIHGATFSSESMHEGSPVTAVQIGDPFTQKRVIDFVLAARDLGLISGITDNGAGGLSSSVGEMATITGGATIDLAKVPLKYPGLEDWQIVVSESQERMSLSTRDVQALEDLAKAYNVEVSDIGEFNDDGYFCVTRGKTIVALLELEFLHDGVPKLKLDAVWYPIENVSKKETAISTNVLQEQVKETRDANAQLQVLLSHPNIASKEFVIRQYDHEVQGGSVVKPLMGEDQMAPCDAAVIKPIYGEKEGLVVSNGICPQWSEHDPYLMAISAVDEAVRNAVAVGADPKTICLLDNFCWPDPVASERNLDGPYKLGQLVRTCEGLYDACIAYGAPLISGKDSMKNDFDDGVVRLSIPPTLLVSAIAKTPDSLKSVTMQFKKPGDVIFLLSAGTCCLPGSHHDALFGEKQDDVKESGLPSLDLPAAAQMYRKVFEAIQKEMVRSIHDLSEGGLAVALAECCIGSRLGAKIHLQEFLERVYTRSSDQLGDEVLAVTALFGEGPGAFIITVAPEDVSDWEKMWAKESVTYFNLGTVESEPKLVVSRSKGNANGGSKHVLDISVEQMRNAWRQPLPFD